MFRGVGTPTQDHQKFSRKLHREREQKNLQSWHRSKPKKHVYRLMKKTKLNKVKRPALHVAEAGND